MRTLQKLLFPVLAAALLGTTVGTPATVSAAANISLTPYLKMHPLLQYGMQAQPLKMVRVIVQKTSVTTTASSIVALVPGMRLDEQFTVAPAFTATLPQAAVVLLALSSQVRYVSPDGAVQVIPGQAAPATTTNVAAPKVPVAKVPKAGFDGRDLLTTYPVDTGATRAWSASDGHVETGAKVTVATIDSGIDVAHTDLSGQVLAVNVNRHTQSAADGYGHGTHVAGIINGHDPAGQYLGIAPSASLVSVKVADDSGMANESDLLRGLEWVFLNRDKLKIRALNLSVSTTVPQSYATSPINAAVEHLWRDGVTVVTSAGNLGAAEDAVWYAPGNDPYVITVGCLDENETAAPGDDSLCPISSRGVTLDGFAKPDMVAPGRKIASALATGPNGLGVVLAAEFPERITADTRHIRLSGTSMAAPMVTGAVALLLERAPNLTPSQIKQLLVASSRAYPGQLDKAGTLNITAALLAADHPPVATQAVILPVGGTAPPLGANTLLWDGTRWGSAYWDGARWGSTYWDGARWGSAAFDGARWGSAYWDGARWGSAYWDGARWGSAAFDGARWGSTEWDGARWG
jgi:serine protease AprX